MEAPETRKDAASVTIHCTRFWLSCNFTDARCGLEMDETGSTTNIRVKASFTPCIFVTDMNSIVIVCDNGVSGFLGEHSCMDGTATLRMNEFVLGAISHGKITPETGSPSEASPEEPKELAFEVDAKAQEYITLAEKNFDELIGDHELEVSISRSCEVYLIKETKVLHYDKHGANQIKAHKVSPDAFAQLIKQLAFHKLYQRPAVTYESTQTRRFQKGRTEVTRSASQQSKEWVAAMTYGSFSVSVTIIDYQGRYI